MKKRIILLLLFLMTVVSGCQKKSPHHTTATGPDVEINGSLKLHKVEYLILHNTTTSGVFIGDSVVDCVINLVASFPGCYINHENTTNFVNKINNLV
ncbi:MAG: hypothetical protein PUC65_14020 [Clostridiales bacterium]|nr:hypothetical protein [Clostridiales bacterium]